MLPFYVECYISANLLLDPLFIWLRIVIKLIIVDTYIFVCVDEYMFCWLLFCMQNCVLEY